MRLKHLNFKEKIIDQQLKLITNYKIKLSEITFSYNSHNNIVKQSLDFFSSISPEIYSLLLKSIEYKTLSIKNNRFEKSYSGVTYSLYNNSYYDIFLNSLANPFITLNHELMHGYVNLISNRKFDNLSNNILYREVGSLLIEIYANEYLLRNKLISYDEYVTNFSDLLLNNIYNDIEIIVILFTFAKNLEMKNDLSNVKKFIDDKACVNPNYDIKIKELTNLPLKHHLIYMYSALIAISLYDNFKDDTKDAIKAALDIMVNVDSNNEEEIFKKYNLNINQSLENYIQKNNQLVMKKNS